MTIDVADDVAPTEPSGGPSDVARTETADDRTFLSWTLVLEIEGRWPWQRAVDRAPRAELVRCRPHPACGPYIDPMPSRHFSCRFRAAMLLQQSRMR